MFIHKLLLSLIDRWTSW